MSEDEFKELHPKEYEFEYDMGAKFYYHISKDIEVVLSGYPNVSDRYFLTKNSLQIEIHRCLE